MYSNTLQYITVQYSASAVPCSAGQFNAVLTVLNSFACPSAAGPDDHSSPPPRLAPPSTCTSSQAKGYVTFSGIKEASSGGPGSWHGNIHSDGRMRAHACGSASWDTARLQDGRVLLSRVLCNVLCCAVLCCAVLYCS